MDILNAMKAKIAFVFPGQGTQYVGMGKQLYDTSPAARRIFEKADATLGFSISTLCFEGPQEDLDNTVNAQPAILTVSIACLEALKERLGPLGYIGAPALVAGHSVGEFTALVAAGVLDFEDALKLVRERGRLMKETGEQFPGGMAAVVGLDDATLAEVVEEAQSEGVVALANANSPGQTVLSGEVAALQRAMELAKARGARLVKRLSVDVASHSPVMQQAAQHFGVLVNQLNLRPAQVPLIANISAQALTTVEELRDEISQQLMRPVQWTRSVQAMMAHGVDTFVEIGPGQVLSGLIKRISSQARPITLTEVEVVNLLLQVDAGCTEAV